MTNRPRSTTRSWWSKSTSRFANGVVVAAAALLIGACGGHGDKVAAPIARGVDVGHWRGAFVVEPGHAGINQIHFTLVGTDGRLASDVGAASIAVARTATAPRLDVPLTQYGDGHYATQTSALNATGRWVAFIGVTGKDGAHHEERVQFTIARDST